MLSAAAVATSVAALGASPSTSYDFGLNLPTMRGTSGTGAFLPGVYNFSYSTAQLVEMKRLGFNAIRVPINLETAKDAAALAQIKRITTAIGGRAMLCMFETGSTVTHGTGRVADVPLAIAAWKSVHAVIVEADLPYVRYEIFNEPHGYTSGCNVPPCGTADDYLRDMRAIIAGAGLPSSRVVLDALGWAQDAQGLALRWEGAIGYHFYPWWLPAGPTTATRAAFATLFETQLANISSRVYVTEFGGALNVVNNLDYEEKSTDANVNALQGMNDAVVALRDAGHPIAGAFHWHGWNNRDSFDFWAKGNANGSTKVLRILKEANAAESTAAAPRKGVPNVPVRPNIVLIVSDDLGWGEVSTTPDVATIHTRRIETPNLLRIFGQGGLVFDDAYAGYSVCGPSRTTLMTGRHAGNMYTKTTALNLPSLMRAAGYATALFGKSDPLTNPVDRRSGFDYFLGQDSQAKCHDMYPPTVDAGHRVNSSSAAVQWTVPLRGNNWSTNNVSKSPAARRAACMAHPEDHTYTSDVFETAAASWIRNQTDAAGAGAAVKKPFFAYVAYTTPHAGDWGTTKETGNPVPSDLQYMNESTYPDVEKDHAASVSYMDASVGKLIAGLDLSNTFVFFVSDNGAHEEGGHNHTFFNSTGGLRGFKRSLYEGGVRSPSMVAGPGIAPGTRSDVPWAFWDILPTFAELAGATDKIGGSIDGVSFAKQILLLKEEEGDESESGEAPPRNWTGYWTWGDGKTHTKGYTVRRGGYKGVVVNCSHFYDKESEYAKRPSPDDVWSLYDLENDPFETKDVASLHVEVIDALREWVLGGNFTCVCFQCGYG